MGTVYVSGTNQLLSSPGNAHRKPWIYSRLVESCSPENQAEEIDRSLVFLQKLGVEKASGPCVILMVASTSLCLRFSRVGGAGWDLLWKPRRRICVDHRLTCRELIQTTFRVNHHELNDGNIARSHTPESRRLFARLRSSGKVSERDIAISYHLGAGIEAT